MGRTHASRISRNPERLTPVARAGSALLRAGLGAALIFVLCQAGALRPAWAVTKTVNIQALSFEPPTVNIALGDTVKWVWVSGTHSTTSGTCSGAGCTPDGRWDSGIRSSGEFTHTFDAAGSYPYFCTIHKSSMTGTVNVSGPVPLQARATASPACGAAPLQVAFTGGATGGHSPYQFQWDFGDSSVSTEQSPLHTYAAAGEYTAQCQATDADGSVDGIAISISARDTQVPTITKVKKLTAPLRLVIIGSGFPIHPVVLIDGQPVPATKFVSPTKVVALKGAALKAMLPRNQNVTITVRDADTGIVGCPLGYMRMDAPVDPSEPAPSIEMEGPPAP